LSKNQLVCVTGSKNVPDRVPGCHCGGITSFGGIVPGPPAGVGDVAGFEGVPPVITRVDVLNPRLLELLLDENPPDELVEETPDDMENAAQNPTVIRRIQKITPRI
jgi:hypothetical protein